MKMLPNSNEPSFNLFNDEHTAYIKYLASYQEIEWYDMTCKKNLCQNQSFF